jgi:hypothetical protein
VPHTAATKGKSKLSWRKPLQQQRSQAATAADQPARWKIKPALAQHEWAEV